MKLLNKLANYIVSKSNIANISQDDLFSSLNTSGIKSNAGVVYLCVKMLATNGAGLRFNLFNKQDQYKKIDQHSILNLIEMPNENMSGWDLFYLVISQLNLVGNSYWLKVRDSTDEVRRLYPLNPHAITIKADPSYTITEYEYATINGVKSINPSNIIHFKYLDPDNIVKGKSPVSAFADTLKIDDLASKRHQASFLNNAIPSGVLSTEGTLSQKQINEVSKQFQSSFGGVDNTAKILIASGGFKFSALQQSVKDMELLQSRIFTKESIMELYGVSPALLGKTASTNKATAETEKIVFLENHIKPVQELIIRALNRQLVADIDPSITMSLIDPVPENREQLLREVSAGISSDFLTGNEARELLGFQKGDQPRLDELYEHNWR